MAAQEKGEGRRDPVASVRAFVGDWKAGRVGPKDLAAVAGDLETVRGRIERVRGVCPPGKHVALGEEVQDLLKLLGRQRSLVRPRLAASIGRAAVL